MIIARTARVQLFDLRCRHLVYRAQRNIDSPLMMRFISMKVITKARPMKRMKPAMCTIASLSGAIRFPPRATSTIRKKMRPPSSIGSGSKLRIPRFMESSAANSSSGETASLAFSWLLATSPTVCPFFFCYFSALRTLQLLIS